MTLTVIALGLTWMLMLFLEARPLLAGGHHRELAVFVFILGLAFAMSALLTMALPFPNPADAVRRIVNTIPYIRQILLPGIPLHP